MEDEELFKIITDYFTVIESINDIRNGYNVFVYISSLELRRSELHSKILNMLGLERSEKTLYEEGDSIYTFYRKLKDC